MKYLAALVLPAVASAQFFGLGSSSNCPNIKIDISSLDGNGRSFGNVLVVAHNPDTPLFIPQKDNDDFMGICMGVAAAGADPNAAVDFTENMLLQGDWNDVETSEYVCQSTDNNEGEGWVNSNEADTIDDGQSWAQMELDPQNNARCSCKNMVVSILSNSVTEGLSAGLLNYKIDTTKETSYATAVFYSPPAEETSTGFRENPITAFNVKFTVTRSSNTLTWWAALMGWF